MAFPVTINGRTYTLADFEGTNYVDGFPDALEDFVTQAGDIYNSTSTSSVTIGTGSKSFTTADSGKPYQAGTPLRIADSANPETNFMDCIVTSYSGTSLVVDAFGYAGSGTISSWTINIGGAKTVDGTLAVAQGGTGATTAAAARTNLDVYSKTEADNKFLDVSGEASNVTINGTTTMNGDVTIGDAGTDTLTVNATATMADATLTTADINGGTIDGTTIGGSTPAAGTFTNLTVDGGTVKLDGDHPLGTYNVALGQGAADAITTATQNTAVGSSALTSATTGFRNTAVGAGSQATNITGCCNTAVGTNSLYCNSAGCFNVAVGASAGLCGTGNGQVSVGYEALCKSTTSEQVAVGYRALKAATSGVQNVAVGNQAIVNGTTASYNTAVGFNAGCSLTTGASNTLIGRFAGPTINSYSNNTMVGAQSGYNSAVGNANTFLGACSGFCTNAGANTFVGDASGFFISSGCNNTILGRYNGCQCGYDIRTLNNFSIIANGTGCPVIINNQGQGNAVLEGNNYRRTANKFFCLPGNQAACKIADISFYDQGAQFEVTVLGKHNNQSVRIMQKFLIVTGNFGGGSGSFMTLGSSNSGAGATICFNGGNGRIEVYACTTTATQIVGGVVYAESYGSLYKLLDSACGGV